MKQRIMVLWSGQVPLAVAFWHFAVLYGLLINVVASATFMALMAAEVSTAIGIVVNLLPVPYNIFMVVAVWRSAGAYEGPGQWAGWARIGVIVWMALLSAT